MLYDREYYKEFEEKIKNSPVTLNTNNNRRVNNLNYSNNVNENFMKKAYIPSLIIAGVIGGIGYNAYSINSNSNNIQYLEGVVNNNSHKIELNRKSNGYLENKLKKLGITLNKEGEKFTLLIEKNRNNIKDLSKLSYDITEKLNTLGKELGEYKCSIGELDSEHNKIVCERKPPIFSYTISNRRTGNHYKIDYNNKGEPIIDARKNLKDPKYRGKLPKELVNTIERTLSNYKNKHN